MHVAVLGGGLQGCCLAVALAARGARVTLVDRNAALMSRAAIINEGKIHLGYMYGGDRSMETARTMIAGALAFGPFLARHLGIAPERVQLSTPAVYLAHRDSQHSADETARYLSAVHAHLTEAAAERPEAYFGLELRPPRAWSKSERDDRFDPSLCIGAWQTAESAVNPVAVAALMRERIEADRAIEVRLQREVVAVGEAGDGLVVRTRSAGEEAGDRYDHVVNALWDGRLAIDAMLGQQPRRPWLYRFKHGVRLRTAMSRPPVSTTIVLGPFGEVVHYGDGTIFLTWYPSCVLDRTDSLSPPDWPMHPAEPLRSRIIGGTHEGLAAIVPALRDVTTEELGGASVAGGVIVAWGETDIDDPRSELHQRFAIGVTSKGCYHSVDPGKLTMIPYFAEQCARRIAGGPTS